jgi:very-short-patch-repair endonuclease
MDVVTPEGDDKKEERLGLRIDATLVTKLNLADFQNAVPMLRSLSITNASKEDATGLELRIESIPPFVRPKLWHIDVLAANGDCRITDLDVQLDGALLTRLTEAETATVTLSLCSRDTGQAAMTIQEHVVELLPRNQWGGISHHLPDMVAAFVQPNEPAVERLLKQAADVLRKNGKQPALDGYRGGSQRAWELTSAIWSAVAAMGLDYALPPASFEHSGQKVRSPAQIGELGLATCLDLALLFCAAIEQAGLNPLMVFTKGHAFAGVWLKAEQFSTTVVDDVTALRKRVKLKELLLFETTLVTQRPTPSFSYASQHAAQQIAQENDEAFELAVDIRRARLQRIKPLASAERLVATPVVDQPQFVEPTFDVGSDLPEDDSHAEPDAATLNPKDRLARWQRKLLDLSLRNNLLNFKSGKKALKLEAPDASALEDLLADGQALKLLARPDLMDGADPRNQAIYESREHEDLRREHALDALKRREIFIGVAQDELEPRLVDLYRTARTTLQEGGANTLYVALGFLSWTREDKAGSKYRAPLILVPVTLLRKSARSGFTLTLHDDEPRFNPTLIEMLRQDFKLDLGVADGELPRDDAGLDVRAVWKAVSKAVKDIKGWEVSEDVVLSMFSFAKYLMWKDLTERTEQLRENAVVKHLIDTPRDSYPQGVSFPNPKHLDRDFSPEKTFCPLPADSSQLSAVMAAVRGKDFVLIGPPGTGKSQTISNLIAQCLAEGKRVLFVSEKIAALDVVYRRLREVKLGDFCLELHSNKARKLDVLAQLQNAWDAQGDVDPETWRAQAQHLKRLRDDLNGYVERLHFRHGNGMSIFEAIGRVVDGEDVPALGLRWGNANAHGTPEMAVMREVVDRLAVNAAAVGHGALLNNPLAAVAHSEWSPTWQQGLVDSARDVLPAVHALQAAHERFAGAIGLPPTPLTRRVRGAVADLAKALPLAAGRDWRFVLRADARSVCERLQAGVGLLNTHRDINAQLAADWPQPVVSACRQGLLLLARRRAAHADLGQPWPADLVAELQKGLALIDEVGALTNQLSVPYGEQVDQLNVAQLQRDWAKADKAIWPMSWLAKRKLRAALESTVTGEGEPDVARDLRLLVRVRALRSEIHALELGPATEGVWAGLKTRPEFAGAALRFQQVLLAARQDQSWADESLDAVATGRCGDKLAKELAKVRSLKGLDTDIAALDHLGSATAGLWTALTTVDQHLEAALTFNAAREAVRIAGSLVGDHQHAANGDCGAAMAADWQRLRQRTAVEQQLAGFDELRAVTAGLWNGLGTQQNEVDKALKFQASMASAIANLATTPDDIAGVKAPLDKLIGEGNALLEEAGPIAAAGQTYLQAWVSLQPKIDRLSAAGDFTEAAKTGFGDVALEELAQRCTAIVQSAARLNAWCAWRKVCQQATVLGLAPVVAGIENGAIGQAGAGAVRRAFETDYSRWWLNAVVDNEPVIRTFVAAEHEKRIGDFRALEAQYTELTRAWVRATLCADLPKQDGVTRNSDWGILRHEMNKKRAHMPLRALMSSIPSALTKLTPCLLMSPLSIAQYLSADANAFDVVVFDEASQIPVWDAVGAIARGKQVVMVGDPKQLPPTNFFDRAESSADEEDVEGDLESILDECMGANLPTMNLAWHYRSRNESLIAFSNHHYYGGALVTFPSPVTEDRAVSFHHVNGTYEKGGARINKPEAKALVADIVARLKSPGFRESKLTIGVVTFNTEQKNLIEDLLDDERRRDPAIEPYFDEVELEPLFVKNLESVQGDERDIMYFSITYGPDLAGAVSMNFGPMNREGGERRLNVAITRARHELRVFSSLKGEQMDLARTQAKGVRDLKHFLEFAERGPRALAEATRGSLGDFESPFEQAVASALAGKGWELRTQIGASSFRIDLAVVHPDARGSYLTGIECDGATYHRSATARDRDMLREQVLRGLGWDILRVWSTDWWVDKAGTLEKLDGKLRGLLETSRARRAEEAAKQAAADAAAAAIAKAREEAAPIDTATSTGAGINGAAQVQLGLGLKHAQTEQQPQEQEGEVYARNVVSAAAAGSAVFVEADPASVVDTVKAAAFFDNSYDTVLMAMIAHVVEVEGPVLNTVLARRIARAHGWQRTGARIQERVDVLAAKSHHKSSEDVGTFYWPAGRGPELPLTFRRASDATARVVDEICMLELVSLAREIVASSQSGDAAVAAIARELGLQRLRTVSRTRIEFAIALAAG